MNEQRKTDEERKGMTGENQKVRSCTYGMHGILSVYIKTKMILF